MLLILLVLSAGLTISLLHVIFPRATPPEIIVPEASIQKENVVAPAPPPPPEVTYSLPVRIEIPKLSVVAPVAAVGLTEDNAMDIDKDKIAETAWYKLGPKPGEKGSAVIAGHYGWLNGQGAIFNDLHTLQPGDNITVYDEKGRAVNFIVRETRKYDLANNATEVFRSIDNKAHLNLITCGGSWDYLRQTYTDRIVIFSDLHFQPE